MKPESKTPTKISLRDKILQECIKITSESGTNGINMREISRRLNISHMAPYKHFASKEEILTELKILGYKMFSQSLEKNLPLPESSNALENRFKIMMHNYEEFTKTHPELYQIIFNSKNPNMQKNLELEEVSTRSFSILINQIASMKAAGLMGEVDVFEAALLTFIMTHGFMTLRNNRNIESLKYCFQSDVDEFKLFDTFLRKAIFKNTDS